MSGLCQTHARDLLVGRSRSLPSPCSSSSPSTRLSGHPETRRLAASAPFLSRLRKPQTVACSASATGIDGKLISSSEIPAFISRTDIITQVYRWATIEAGSRGLTNFGSEMTVAPIYKEDSKGEEGKDKPELWGFDVDLVEEGKSVCKIRVRMDDSVVEKHQFIGIGEDGFPTKEGNVAQIEGKNMEIWKVGNDEVTDDIREVIRRLCGSLGQAVTKYYSFGSCFIDEVE